MSNSQIVRIILLTLVCLPLADSHLWAQPKGRIAPNRQTPEQLDTGEGERVIAAFRENVPNGDLAFRFLLRHRPRRGEEVSYQGTFLGTWTPFAQSRIDLTSDAGKRILQWSGPSPQLWIAENTSSEEDVAPEKVTGPALFEPLLPGLTFSPFELQMPFIYWDDFQYEGTERIRGRATHSFLFTPPENMAQTCPYTAIRTMIDADFNVLIRAQFLGEDGNITKTLELKSFKEVGGQWIIRRVDLDDEQTGDRTIFETTAAATGLDLAPSWFRPISLKKPIHLDIDFQDL